MKKTRIILFSCSLAFAGCSGDKGGKQQASNDAVAKEQAENGDGKDVDPHGEDKLLQVTKKTAILETNQGRAEVKLKPIIRFATPVALETIYKRVFPASGVRNTVDNVYFVANPTEYFSPLEKVSLGGFNINAPVGSEVNVSEVPNLSLSYTRSLRGFLADACTHLVTVENNKLATAPQTSKLVRAAGVPTIENLNNFATALFGYKHPAGTFPQVMTYRTIITENLSELAKAGFAPSSPEYVAALKDNYVLYCIAMCQDPELYTY